MALVEQAWELSEKARNYTEEANREVSAVELFEKVFMPSGLVDIEQTKAQGEGLEKIFFKSPYGLEFKADINAWIPFRHSQLDK
jgi:hypothetical protein